MVPTGKLRSRRGVSVLLAVLVLAVVALGAVIAVPWVGQLNARAEKVACESAVDSAWRALTADTLFQGGQLTREEAREALARAMPEKEQICPAGGEVYLIPRENGSYSLFCGLHGEDAALRTSLNAETVRERTVQALADRPSRGEAVPQEVTVTLHGKPFPVRRSEERVDLHLGTRLTEGYEGAVALFQTDERGELTWFCYADENGWAEFDYREGGA